MRTPARVLSVALSFVVMFVAGTSAALADQPTGGAWQAAEGRSTLDNVLLYGGGTVGIFIVLWLFGLMTARNNYVPPAPSQDLAHRAGNSAAHH